MLNLAELLQIIVLHMLQHPNIATLIKVLNLQEMTTIIVLVVIVATTLEVVLEVAQAHQIAVQAHLAIKNKRK